MACLLWEHGRFKWFQADFWSLCVLGDVKKVRFLCKHYTIGNNIFKCAS